MLLGAPKAGIHGMSGCLMLQSWEIHNKFEQKAAIAVSRHGSSQKINPLCISRIKIACVSRGKIKEMREV